MNRLQLSACIGLAIGGTWIATGVTGANIIPVTYAGSAGYTTFQNAFNAQPITDPVAGLIGTGTPSDLNHPDGDTGSLNWYDDGRTGYIDFGANWATVAITDTYELTYDRYGDKAATGDGNTYFWSPTANVNDPDKVQTVNFGFETPSGLDGKQRWVHRYSGPAITPQARYLLVTAGAGYGSRSWEWAFVSAPEPASLALLGLGGLLMLGRKRRRVL